MWLVAEVDGGHAYCSLGVLHTNAVWLRTAWQYVGKGYVQVCMWFVDTLEVRSFRSFKKSKNSSFWYTSVKRASADWTRPIVKERD